MSQAEEDALIVDRQLTPDLPGNEIASALQAMQSHFGSDWLLEESNSESNPIRRLWKRRDFIATEELFILGDSVKLIEPLSANWLRDCITKMKSSDRNMLLGTLSSLSSLLL
jgi:hypothetical protein